jgi:hypothetical protein
MVEKKNGGRLATRRCLARALLRLVKGGMAPYFIVRPEPSAGLRRLAAADDQSSTVADLCAVYSWPKDLVGGGDNGFYRAASGPAPCTGLGAPIGEQLARAFGASQRSDVTVSPAIVPHAISAAHSSKARRRVGARG